MKVNNKRSLWQTFAHGLKGAALMAAMIAMGVSGTALQAKLPNVGYDLQGCRWSSDISELTGNGYKMVTLPGPDGPVDTYVCNDADYVKGNLFQWAELDRVPHRIVITTGSGDGLVDFNFTVSGDFQTDDPATGDPLKRGWIEITTLVLDPVLSDPVCFDLEYASTQDLLLKIPGAQGAYSTIYRSVNVEGMPANTTCVALWDATLAVGSSRYTGSSLQSYLLNWELESGDPGKQTLSLPTAATQELTKTMGATQDLSHLWTIQKSADPTSVNFGDTCTDYHPDDFPIASEEVTITVTWVKEDATADGNVNVTTVITATNNASRDLKVDLNDTIYNGDTLLELKQFGEKTLLANAITEIGRHSLVVQDTADLQLRDVAVMSYIDSNPFAAPLTLTAVADALVQPSGITKNVEATVKDHEWIDIVHGDITYAAWENANIGTFDSPYSEGDPTDGDVNWTSLPQSESGSVTFNKTIYLAEPTITSSNYLRDEASLSTVDGFTASSNMAQISISSSATVSLTIIKTIPDILQGDETADFNFTVSDGTSSKDFIIPFTADETENNITIDGLDPGTYSVQENPTPGFNAKQPNPVESIDLNLPICSAEVNFVNELAGAPRVLVAKITLPGSINNGERLDGDWNMTLYRQNTDGITYTPVSSLLTTEGDVTDEFVIPGGLAEGNYKIVELVKDGWFEQSKSGECVFDIDYPRDTERSDIVCTYTNAKYAKIVIDKVTDPAGSLQSFAFTHTIPDVASFALTDADTPWSSGNIVAGLYTVTESDPTPDFDLETLVCEETDTPDINTETTTDLSSRTATINLDWGETVTCTYTNLERGEVEVIKYENGGDPASTWTFELSGPMEDNPQLIGTGTIPTNPLTFNHAKLIPGKEYKICEMDVGPKWTTTWEVDGVTVTPEDVEYVYPQEASNADICIIFTARSAEAVQINVYNDKEPEGDPRTIGYWKNWNTCTGGGQADAAALNGNTLLNDVLPIRLGATDDYHISIAACEDGVAILNKSDTTDRSKKRASDAAYGMAAQLVAAKANLGVPVSGCQDLDDAILSADDLLSKITFDPSRKPLEYLTPKKSRKEPELSQRAEANRLAEVLDRYNNGELCP